MHIAMSNPKKEEKVQLRCISRKRSHLLLINNKINLVDLVCHNGSTGSEQIR